MRKAILSLMVAVALMAPFCCYGYENSYIDTPEIWLNNDRISIVSIEDKHLDGYLQYYIDSDSHTLYGHISHSGNADSSVPVFVGIEGDSFSIEFDENGIDDNDFGAAPAASPASKAAQACSIQLPLEEATDSSSRK